MGHLVQYKLDSKYPDNPFYWLVRHFMLVQMHMGVLLRDGIVHFIGYYVFWPWNRGARTIRFVLYLETK